jgi:Ca2+-transporting ATPase
LDEKGTPENDSEHNVFAFSPTQLAKLFDPKNLNILRAMGCVRGLAIGLRTDLNKGLSPHESILHGKITLEEVWQRLRVASDNRNEPEKEKSKFDEPNIRLEHTMSRRRTFSITPRPRTQIFQDRRRVYSENRIPARKSKNLFQLMWMVLKDQILVGSSSAQVDYRFFWWLLPLFPLLWDAIKAFGREQLIKLSGFRASRF